MSPARAMRKRDVAQRAKESGGELGRTYDLTPVVFDGCIYGPGKQMVVAAIEVFLERGAEFRVLRTVALGPLVINSRDDILVMENGEIRTFHLAAGMFFVENGKIVEWTDYLIR